MTKLRVVRSISHGGTGINRVVTHGPQSRRYPVAPFLVAVTVMGALSLSGGLANAAPADTVGDLFHPSSSAAPFLYSTATSTVLATSPASPITPGTPLKLTATVSPATAVGTVQFKDGTAKLGDPVAVSNGVAAGTTSTLPLGSHQLMAVFIPTDPAVFDPSTSPAQIVAVANSAGPPTPGSPAAGHAPAGPLPIGSLPIGPLPVGSLPIQPPVPTGPSK